MKLITLEDNIRRIDVIDHKGYMIKTYYEKADRFNYKLD